MKQSHTPTPWENRDGEIVAPASKNSRWTNRVGDPLIVCNFREVIKEYDDDFQVFELDNAKANAAFIVKAVNSHEALVSELQAILNSKDQFGDVKIGYTQEQRIRSALTLANK